MPEDEVHLWVADHRVRWDELEEHSALLDADERERAARFRFRKDFRRFVFGHAQLRSILASCCGSPADALEIARRCATCGSAEHGKPYLLQSPGERSPIRFSCSYSDELVVIAVSNGAEVGVDVERLVPAFAWGEVAETALSSGERSLLGALDGDAAARAFYGIWTRKEAVSKASGRGLEQLTEMDTCRWANREGGGFDVVEGSAQAFVGTAFELPGHAAAVAVTGNIPYRWVVKESVRPLGEGA